MMMDQIETPVAMLFREWLTLKRKWDAAAAGDLSDEVNNAWCTLVFAAADAVLDAPSAGPDDFLLKLFAQTFDGEYEIGDSPRGAEIWAEARCFIGLACETDDAVSATLGVANRPEGGDA
ncbi:hypothetical protein [Pararhodobacter marinus]|uniref:hypothetical protein n=1 Tax=Pararhodobacter marinus TaxID=2184063 RepID=UPI0035155166